LRGGDVPSVSWTDKDCSAVNNSGKVVRVQPIAALENFKKAAPQRQRPVRETYSAIQA
jgi:hypothetical protein